MRTEVLPDAEKVAKRATAVLVEAARAAVAARGRFLLALSGGRTPARMLQALSEEDLPWNVVHVYQVDERLAPADDPQRNLTQLQEKLLDQVPIPAENVHTMPVEDEDLKAASARYAGELEKYAGSPAILDVVHLGLGADGHTASLVPGDPVLDIADRDVATTEPFAGRRRMTLTFPVLNRARSILWIVTGKEKVKVVPRLSARDRSIPAGCVRSADAVLLVDEAAASGLASKD